MTEINQYAWLDIDGSSNYTSDSDYWIMPSEADSRYWSMTIFICPYCGHQCYGELEDHVRKRHMIVATPREERFKE